MARIRTIKPSFFKSDDVSVLPLRARLTWIGLWTQCDDQGRTKDHVRLIKADIWPLDNDVSLADIEDDLSTLAARGRIVRYEVDGQRYLEVVNWSEHQAINRPSRCTIPPPNGRHSYPQVSPHAPLSEPSRGEGKGKEGKGRDARASAREPPTAKNGTSPPDSEPPRKCQKHTNVKNPPDCGACGSARKDHARWEAARNARIASLPKCRLHRGQPADNCAVCRSEELNPA